MTLPTFGFIVCGVLLNALAQLLLKSGTSAMGGAISLGGGQAVSTLLRIATQPWILAGLACYGVSVLVWIMALSRTDVTLAYPMLSLGYVAASAGACLFLGEPVSLQRLCALAIILAGVALLARS